jgi:hypothetical protein
MGESGHDFSRDICEEAVIADLDELAMNGLPVKLCGPLGGPPEQANKGQPKVAYLSNLDYIILKVV